MDHNDIPLSLYVHLPWCVRKCPYCDFNSHTMSNDTPLDRYVEALLQDLDSESERTGGRKLISVFLGGGTPSVFSPKHIATLLARIDDRFELASDIEVTMEANPGTVECGDPAGYRTAGVNRLSIGAQSFSPGALQTLGRIHSVDDIRGAVTSAREAGFDNINIDLMYGLPAQGVGEALYDIEQAAELEPDHLSWYQLTLEPNTVFHARPPTGMPGADAVFDIQSRGEELLAGLGFEQYEVSAWAKNGMRCRHNLNYWTFGDYLAVGSGAHGKVTAAREVLRYSKPANPRQYIETIETGGPAAELLPVGPDDRLFEFMLNVLRLNDEFDEQLLRARAGLPGDDLRSRLEGPVGKGMISACGENSWRVTALGRRFLNDLQAEFLPDQALE